MIENIKNITYFFDKNDRKSLIILFILFLFTGLIELVGIASIVPFVGLISDPDYITNSKIFSSLLFLENYDSRVITLISGISIVFLFILSNGMNAFTLWRTINYTANQSHKISQHVYTKYLNQPYGFFVNNNISTISRNILDISVSITESIFLPILQIISRLIVMVLISILLISINPVVFMFSLVILAILYFFIFNNIKKKLKLYGNKRLIANDVRFKNINDCMNSIKDIKFYNSEKYYRDSFSIAQRDFLNLTASSTLLTTLPRYLIEIFAFGGFFAVILYIIYIDSDLKEHLPTIALFILASYRILPSMQQIFAFTGSIKFNYPALKVIREIYTMGDNINLKNQVCDMNEEIKFSNVSFSYQDKKLALKNISFGIIKNSVTAIIGTTGAGKTTLIDLLLGLYNPDKGEILINSRNYDEYSDRLKIGYVPQLPAFTNNSIKENIAIGISNDKIDIKKIIHVLKLVNMNNHINTLPKRYDTIIGDRGTKLSGGQLQRLAIARALYFSPNILILDEATNALDNKTEEEVFTSLKNIDDMTIILVTHRSSAIQQCDQIFHLTSDHVKQIDKNSIQDLSKYLKKTDDIGGKT